jgi:hypothetical protein
MPKFDGRADPARQQLKKVFEAHVVALLMRA